MKYKNPNLLKPLHSIFYQNSQFYYASEPFSFHHFNVRHPFRNDGVLPACFFLYYCFKAKLDGNSHYLAIFLGSTQEAPMGASCLFIKKVTKCSSNTLLRLITFFSEQTLLHTWVSKYLIVT